MATVKFMWTEPEKSQRQRWRKVLLPIALRLKKAEANVQRCMKK